MRLHFFISYTKAHAFFNISYLYDSWRYWVFTYVVKLFNINNISFYIRPNQWFLCSPRLKYFLILNTFREVKIIHEFSLEQLNSSWNSGEALEIIGQYFTLVQSLVWCRQSDDKLKMYPKQFFKTMEAISSYILNKKDIENSLTLISIHNCSSETVYFEERLSK